MHPLGPSLLAALAAVPCSPPARPQAAGAEDVEPRFAWPCDDYVKSVHGKGFGVHVARKGSPFHDSWHLAEDVWKPPGMEVRAVADGVVRYSAFSPTWTDAAGFEHWNLGNVIVIEHALDPPDQLGDDELVSICSFYVHLAANRRVAVGERVARDQAIGRIGADQSDENGRYPAYLHFGLHKGPYVQVPPSLVRELTEAARSKDGLHLGTQVLRGELELRQSGETSVLVTAKESGESVLFSLLAGGTAPTDAPPDIMTWCAGYGARETLDEWIEPSRFLRARRSSTSGAKTRGASASDVLDVPRGRG